jgi:hypothetical protein
MPRRPFESLTESPRLPHPAAPAMSLAGFVACPVQVIHGLVGNWQAWQQAVYLAAFAEAQAVARPSLLERDLLGVWN